MTASVPARPWEVTVQSLSRAIQPASGSLGLLSGATLWDQSSVLGWLLYQWWLLCPGAVVGASGQLRARAGDAAALAPGGDAALCEGPRQQGWDMNGAQPGILVMSGKAV